MEFTSPTPDSQDSAVLSLLTANNAPRALLVSLDRNGRLHHEPVADGQSLLNIQAELLDHLNAYPHTTDWLTALRDYCDGRLAARGEAKATGGVSMARPGGWDIVHIWNLVLPGRQASGSDSHIPVCQASGGQKRGGRRERASPRGAVMRTVYFIATDVALSRPITKISTLRRVFKRIQRKHPLAHMVRETIFR